MPRPSQIDCRHGSRESHRILSYFKRGFVTITSAIPLVKAYSSASADLANSLTVFLTMQRGLRFSTAQVHRLCACRSVAACVHVHGLRSVTISIKHFAFGTPLKYRVMRFMFISSLSVGQKEVFRAGFLHAVHDVQHAPGTCTTA